MRGKILQNLCRFSEILLKGIDKRERERERETIKYSGRKIIDLRERELKRNSFNIFLSIC
ncbi:hypothetical protein CSE_10290 [Caldisericum exile AZM16c01]|uniref:Uncharacterized protein n=1 Tax=Caldisericum exile (strain DSM 21853 / NBRC 104410 / AZM16c01) TaxID=511051 RepID=A0A7U6JG88_CALEA|nr:hypothetical protein CSE_10290 [Caldisericum exile AZM16c01]